MHPIVSIFAAPVLAGVARQRSPFRSGSRPLSTLACQHGLGRSVYWVETWGQRLTEDVKVLRPSPHEYEKFWGITEGPSGLRRSRVLTLSRFCQMFGRFDGVAYLARLAYRRGAEQEN
jgi:hypothetical protein